MYASLFLKIIFLRNLLIGNERATLNTLILAFMLQNFQYIEIDLNQIPNIYFK